MDVDNSWRTNLYVGLVFFPPQEAWIWTVAWHIGRCSVGLAACSSSWTPLTKGGWHVWFCTKQRLSPKWLREWVRKRYALSQAKKIDQSNNETALTKRHQTAVAFLCNCTQHIFFIYAFFSGNMLMGRLGFFMSYLQNSTKVMQWRTIHERKSEMLTEKTASWVFVWYLFL